MTLLSVALMAAISMGCSDSKSIDFMVPARVHIMVEYHPMLSLPICDRFRGDSDEGGPCDSARDHGRCSEEFDLCKPSHRLDIVPFYPENGWRYKPTTDCIPNYRYLYTIHRRNRQ